MSINVTLSIERIVWDKLQHIMGLAGSLEVSGVFTSSKDTPFHVVDFDLLEQECETTETIIEDTAFVKYMSEKAKKGIDPGRCMRIWVHTHPFSVDDPVPSQQDETTFDKLMEQKPDWSIMLIVGPGGHYGVARCRLVGAPTTYISAPVNISILEQSLPIHKKWDKVHRPLVTKKVLACTSSPMTKTVSSLAISSAMASLIACTYGSSLISSLPSH
ncbi:hypothetical protein LCGC14_2511360, partial [marine sediment metagenome]